MSAAALQQVAAFAISGVQDSIITSGTWSPNAFVVDGNPADVVIYNATMQNSGGNPPVPDSGLMDGTWVRTGNMCTATFYLQWTYGATNPDTDPTGLRIAIKDVSGNLPVMSSAQYNGTAAFGVMPFCWMRGTDASATPITNSWISMFASGENVNLITGGIDASAGPSVYQLNADNLPVSNISDGKTIFINLPSQNDNVETNSQYQLQKIAGGNYSNTHVFFGSITYPCAPTLTPP